MSRKLWLPVAMTAVGASLLIPGVGPVLPSVCLERFYWELVVRRPELPRGKLSRRISLKGCLAMSYMSTKTL